MKNFNIFGVHWKIRFSGGRIHEKSIYRGEGDLNRGPWTVCWFNGREAWQKRGRCWYPNVHYKQSKQSQSNNKLLWIEMYPGYHKEQKTFIEASYTNNIHTGEKGLCCCNFSRFVSGFLSDKVKKCVVGALCSVWVILAFLEVNRLSNYCL